jgi:serine/threonine protein kinase
MAAGLEYIHSKNVLHRDIALRNLLLTKSSELKFADFGLATYIAPDGTREPVKGSSAGLAPEMKVALTKSNLLPVRARAQ